MDSEFEVKFKQYQGDTQSKSSEYTTLLNDSIKTSKYIGTLSRYINQSKKNTQYWSLKILQQQRECNDRDDQIKEEKLSIVKHYHDLKRKMATQRAEKEAHLGTLSTNSLQCMETLHDY